MPIFIHANPSLKLAKSRVSNCLQALLDFTDRSKACLEVNFVGPQKIRELKSQFLGINEVTDVLSFPMEAKAPKGDLPWYWGGVVICSQVARKQAKKAKRSFFIQVIRLAVHGFVHLEGLDHEVSLREEKRFFKRESEFLQFLTEKGLVKWDGRLAF